ncbi:hypothetical protein HYPSUDRAFT_146103 [Hypholoma sublateritium FD-334 SS-4]|uniref:Phytase A n=1 Tax=Hypholoma sublateritium (strain FD-334 SS-4) TaxID=945553 RepID=A0A0D2NM48_HYPSF|nr:hypothetical protein HYPSUDRAFT_146103 [Hypholoma sublateritium FD-334 SS-4]
MLLPLGAIALLFSQIHACAGSAAPPVITQFAPPAVQHSWAAYTPYFAVEPYTPPPEGCRIDQVRAFLQRHGARFPTSGASTGILTALNKLQSATSFTDPRLDFLRNYTYALGKNGDLIPFGAFQSEEAGKEAYARYSHLVSPQNLPFVRASSAERTVDSATNWTLGFSIASNHVLNPPLAVGNDTLDDSMCPNAGSSDAQTGVWTAIYGAPIAARLNAAAPGANLTAADISAFIPICPFESAAKDATSPFCALFTPAEFAQFEYFGDLDKFYGTGYGQPLGRVQGVGYVNELLARLTGAPVRLGTQVNATLDTDPTTFPLSRALYADFTHDNQMAAIYAALGLFAQRAPLDPAAPDARRTWVASRLTPFSGRMVVERLACAGGAPHVRVLVNDALQPLEFCGSDRDGLCTLAAFVASQAYARGNGLGDFAKCFT